MMARPVANYLACFGSVDLAPADPVSAIPMSPASDDQASPEDLALMIQAAHGEGYALGMAEARAGLSAELAQERILFEDRLARERSSWTQQESERLSHMIGAAFCDLETRIAASVTRILQSFLTGLLHRKAVEALAVEIRTLLGDKAHKIIELRGPDDLLGELRQKLSDLDAAVSYVTASSVDVKAIADQTIIDSRLEVWFERLKTLPE